MPIAAHPRLASLVLLAIASLALSACHPGNKEAKLLRESCDAGDANACNKFAAKLQKGEYVLRDEPRAAVLFDTACTRGIGDGCASLGVMLQRGSGGVKRDTIRAIKLFQQGCDGRAMEGCARLGALYRTGRGVPRSAP